MPPAVCKGSRTGPKGGSQVSRVRHPVDPRRRAAGDFRHAREPV